MTAPVVDRILPNLGTAIKRFLLDTRYTVANNPSSGQSVEGTLLTFFPAVAVIPGFPDDLVKLTTPTLSIVTPMAFSSAETFFGEVAGLDQILLVDLWGFVVKQGKDIYSKQYRDRLLNDVFWLFDRIGRRQGIPLYDEIDRTEVGAVEIQEVRGRLVPPNTTAIEIEADRYRFHVALDVAYTGDAGQDEE